MREDFDVEHANDAELLLAEMEFNVSDHPSERELKLQVCILVSMHFVVHMVDGSLLSTKVVRIYNEKLEERNRRKRFVIDRGLIDMKQLQTVRWCRLTSCIDNLPCYCPAVSLNPRQ